MKFDQLPLFLRRTFSKSNPTQVIDSVSPTGESSFMQTLPAFHAYVGEKYAPKTAKMYWGDVKELALFLKNKKVADISSHDLQQWIETLLSASGKALERKTVTRKVSAIITYSLWLQGLGAITKDPTASLTNTRIQSPLPDYLYENEIKSLYTKASRNTRMYLLVLLFLETGMKSHELFAITKAHVDISDPYRPEIWIKHSGKQTKKDRKVALPPQFVAVYTGYIAEYEIEDTLFPYSNRFIQMLFENLKKETGIAKELTPKTLRHSHVVRGYKRGESPDSIFDRIGLAPYSRPEADEMYTRLARKGM
jgi:site-specific recombinase XerD